MDTRLDGIGMTSARTRDRLILRLTDQGIQDAAVLERIRSVPRHIFVDEALASRAYEDTALPLGHGQTISQPFIVARMTEALRAGAAVRSVLEIGTGCGYQTAVLAGLVPQVYGQEMADEKRQFAGAANGNAVGENRRDLAKREAAAGKAGPASPPRSEAPGALGVETDALKQVRERQMFADGASMQSLAQGAQLGELFRYEIAKPVSLERQRSALLPIVAEPVVVERVAIYDERVLAKHPLSGVRLKNSTALHLMQGPITVYDAGGYCGDARIEDMAPGSERLLSYAVALDVEVVPRAEPRPEEIVNIRLVKGTLVASRRLARARKLEVKNSGDKPVKLLIEHPIESGWKLVKPVTADETARDRYRFAVVAEPGKPATLEIDEEMPIDQTQEIANLDDSAILFYSRARATSPAVKESLAEVVRRKQEIERIVREKADRDQEINAIGQEQARIRENMGRLERTSDLYTRYVQKFSQQETRVETLREEIVQRQAQEQQARQAFDTYLLQFDVK